MPSGSQGHPAQYLMGLLNIVDSQTIYKHLINILTQDVIFFIMVDIFNPHEIRSVQEDTTRNQHYNA